MVDGRRSGSGWLGLEGQLAKLTPWQWLGLILVVAIILPLLAGVLVEAVFTTMQALQQFRR
jgi:hypothetical protein